jgi:ERCC4-type nuclease
MTIFIDKQGTSAEKALSSLKLVEPIRALGEQVEVGKYIGDFSFLGWRDGGIPEPIGGEYKTLTEFLTASSDGRLVGTQLKKLCRTYPTRYLLIEGLRRVSPGGILETFDWVEGGKGKDWVPARGRGPNGWTAQEFWKRIGLIERKFGVVVYHSSNLNESARWIVSKYREWQEPPEKHSSWQQCDRTDEVIPRTAMIPTSEEPGVLQWARDIPGVGATKATWVALHFKSPFEMAIAGPSEWQKISWLEVLKGGKGTRRKSFSKEAAEKIVQWIRTGKSR